MSDLTRALVGIITLIMKKIPVGGGEFAFVDDEDFEAVSKFNWRARGKIGRRYVHRCGKNHPDGMGCVSLHRFLVPDSGTSPLDHRNGNTLDNRRNNIRIVSGGQNAANRRKHKATVSRYKGVGAIDYGRWSAHASKDGDSRTGSYASETEAAIAYDTFALELFGEFAAMNLPIGNEVGAIAEPALSKRVQKLVAIARKAIVDARESYDAHRIAQEFFYDRVRASARMGNHIESILKEMDNAKAVVRIGLPESRLCDGEVTPTSGCRQSARCADGNVVGRQGGVDFTADSQGFSKK